MSADNWAICPKCRKSDPFMGNSEDEHTLREDYSLGIDEHGIFEVSYRAHCTTCRFSYEFVTAEPASPKE